MRLYMPSKHEFLNKWQLDELLTLQVLRLPTLQLGEDSSVNLYFELQFASLLGAKRFQMLF